MRHAQLTASHIVLGTSPVTHVRVEVFEIIGPGVRRRLDALDLSFSGVIEDDAARKAAVEAQLAALGLLDAGSVILSEAEARATNLPQA